MKTNPLFTLTLVLIILLSIISCTKTEEIDKLPPITMEGKNTFGCLVNGKSWIPETDGGLFNERLSVRYEGNYLGIQALISSNRNNLRQLIHVDASFSDLGIYKIPPLPFSGEMFTNSKNKPMGTIECTSYKCILEDTEIEILYIDTSKRIISGTFSYKNLTNRCGDVINITDGRFDVRY
ncbi:MAG: hypothetical protein R2774_01375 [Saprospiraceae bacterium]